MTLIETHTALREALQPLGIEVGPEVLDVWRDREVHGDQPLPVDALQKLAALAGLLIRDRRRAEATRQPRQPGDPEQAS